ncbi:restriction endonuclease [Candidatus Woesearchaeota archaeon]|nr:restriction endonuclease [Candidatus Woesearchaeota archaeon]
MTKKLKMKNNDLKNNFSSMPREEKINVLLDYAKECYKNGHKPSKKEIRRKFHVEIYNYFDNTPDYHRKAGIEVSLRNYPKEEAKKMIIDFVQNKAKENHFPMRKEIEKELGIHLASYFINLKELYYNSGVDYTLVDNVKKRKILEANTHKPMELGEQKESIEKFIRDGFTSGFYPGVRQIQKSLNLAFYNLYDDIFEAYKDAGVEYTRPSPILLGKEKEEAFTKIVKELFTKMGFSIIRVAIESDKDFNRYADMTIKDKEGKIYLVEIKAYRKDYCITKREFQQLANYLIKEKVPRGIFITTSNSKKCEFQQINFINGERLMDFLEFYDMFHYFEQIHWIQNSRVNSKEREEYRQIIKNKILEYAKTRNFIVSKREIQEKFRIDLRSIFGEEKPYEKLKKELEILSSFAP